MGPGQQCCNGVCTEKKRDWAGSYWCPHECRDAPWPLGELGTCDSENTWPRSEGQQCDSALACDQSNGTQKCCDRDGWNVGAMSRRPVGVCTKTELCPRNQDIADWRREDIAAGGWGITGVPGPICSIM